MSFVFVQYNFCLHFLRYLALRYYCRYVFYTIVYVYDKNHLRNIFISLFIEYCLVKKYVFTYTYYHNILII